jgi:hypothetical protein
MSVPTKLAAFAAVLVTAFALAAIGGAALDPVEDDPAAAGSGEHGGQHGDRERQASPASGLAVTDGSFQLVVPDTTLRAGRAERFRFEIRDLHGVVQRQFDQEHDRRMHLVVVREDTAVYRHVHPDDRGDGTWEVDLELPDAGTYRAFADFSVDGERRTLAATLFVPGEFRPNPLAPPAPIDRTAGYDVRLAHHGIRAGEESEQVFEVYRDGEAVDVEPYLGAKGHLVALRQHDLAYLHVHPADGAAARAGNRIAFDAEFPTTGRYRLFLQFKHRGAVRTASFTLEVSQ